MSNQTYRADLGALGVAGLLELVLALLGEANAEQAHAVTVGGHHIGVRLNKGLPLAHHGAKLVCCEIHALLQLIDTQG